MYRYLKTAFPLVIPFSWVLRPKHAKELLCIIGNLRAFKCNFEWYILSSWVLTLELNPLLRHPHYNYELWSHPQTRSPMKIHLAYLSYPYLAPSWAQSRYSVNVYWGNESPLLTCGSKPRSGLGESRWLQVLSLFEAGCHWGHRMHLLPCMHKAEAGTRQNVDVCVFIGSHIYGTTRGSFLFLVHIHTSFLYPL